MADSDSTPMTVSFQCSPDEATLLVAFYDLLHTDAGSTGDLATSTLENYIALLDTVVVEGIADGILAEMEEFGDPDLYATVEQLGRIAEGLTNVVGDYSDDAPPPQSGGAERASEDASAAERQG